jgi:cellulose synthase (UDP-forming)
LPVDLRFRVQPSTTIDFSDTINYTPLPDISYFASVGYPFTRLADLSETVVVLPVDADQREISAYLNLMAHIGESTGDPAARVTVTRPGGLAGHPDKDVLMVGAWRGIQSAVAAWGAGGAFRFEGNSVQIASVSPIESMRYFVSDSPDPTEERKRADAVLQAQGQNFSGMVSFERPDAADRTVVLLAGSTPEETLTLVERMRNPKIVESFKGDLVKMDTNGVTSFAVGPQFTLYSKPFWQHLRWYFADRPLLLIALLVVGVALLTMILMWLLQRIASARASDAQTDSRD